MFLTRKNAGRQGLPERARCFYNCHKLTINVTRYSFLKMENIAIQIRICGQVLLVQQQKVSYLCKTTSKKFFTKVTQPAMATMMFQHGGYFGFKVTLPVTDIGDPQILFLKMISLHIVNYL